MPKIITLTTHTDPRGDLTVIQDQLGYSIQRVYYIYNVGAGIERGGHRHKKTIQSLVAIKGSCDVYCTTGESESTHTLNSPETCMIIDPSEWHTMSNFSEDCVLMVISSEKYDINDYIDEKPATR